MGIYFRSMTATGKVVAACAPLALFVAALSGWREFSVISIGAFLALLVAVTFISRPQPVDVSRTLVPQKVTVGESSTGVLTVRNASRRRIGPRDAQDVLGDRLVHLSIPALRAGEVIEEHYVVPARNRGLFDVGPVRLTRSDPLGLFRRLQGQGSIEQLWVRPRVHPLRSISSGWAKDVEGPTSDTSPRGSAAFHALREYQFGDDLRHVHWRTSARRGSLMVRHFVDTRRTQEVVLLDPRATIYTEESFEAAVEVAASVCASGEAAGRSVTLALPLQVEGAQDMRYPALDRLALVKRIAVESAREVMSAGGRHAANASAYVVVTGDCEPQEVVDLARRSMSSGLIIVVRVVPGAEPKMSGVRGGRVLTIPSCDRLGGVWAEAVRRS